MTYYVIADDAFFVIPPAARSEEEARRLASLMGAGKVEAVIVERNMVTAMEVGGAGP